MDKIYLHFSKTVDDYDTIADKVVFKNKEIHEKLVRAIPFDKDKELKILDLGCGTGYGMSFALGLFTNSIITGIDFSPRMIKKARKNLSDFSERIKLIEANFNDIDFKEKYDSIISIAAIHNSTHDKKKKLFEKIFDSLKEKGVFVNGDFYEHESKEINEQNKAVYKKFLEKNLSGNELKVWLRHAFEEDLPMFLSEQFTILKEIGFSNIKLLWLYNNQALYLAYKN